MVDPTTSPDPGAYRSTGSSGEATRRGSDRALGIIVVLIAVWYVLETRNFQVTQFGSGPVGPKTLPTIIGILFGVFGLIVALKPDESPVWPGITTWWRLVAVVGVSFFFGQLLEWLGFIVASTALSIIVGLFFKGPIEKLAPLSLVFAVVIAFIFNNWLGLRLPPGLWGGF